MAGPDLPFRGPPPDRGTWVLAQSFGFDPMRWQRLLPDTDMWPGELDACPIVGRWPRVSRATVLSVGERAHEPVGAVQTYVAAAVWGNGTGAQGVHRRVRVLGDPTTDVAGSLASAVRTLRSEGPEAAYERLHGHANLVKHLGPSFGTKVLYSAGYDRTVGARQPLILDQFVALALNRLVGSMWPTTQGGWTTAQYATYLDIAHKWAADWGCSPDVVERVLFSIGKASPLVVGVLGGQPTMS